MESKGKKYVKFVKTSYSSDCEKKNQNSFGNYAVKEGRRS